MTVILDAQGKPMAKRSTDCPRCKATKDKRVPSCMGSPAVGRHDVCGVCGFEDFGESTV